MEGDRLYTLACCIGAACGDRMRGQQPYEQHEGCGRGGEHPAWRAAVEPEDRADNNRPSQRLRWRRTSRWSSTSSRYFLACLKLDGRTLDAAIGTEDATVPRLRMEPCVARWAIKRYNTCISRHLTLRLLAAVRARQHGPTQGHHGNLQPTNRRTSLPHGEEYMFGRAIEKGFGEHRRRLAFSWV